MNKTGQNADQAIIMTVAALFASGLLAGCLGDDPLEASEGVERVDEPVLGLVVEHEEGTARYGLNRNLESDVWRACRAAGTTLGDICRNEVYPHASNLPQLDETHPAVDILGASFAETSDDLIVTVELARLHESWDHVEPDVYLPYEVHWRFGEGDGAIEGVFEMEVANTEGVITLRSGAYWLEENCNDLRVCWYSVPFEIEYGEPGSIHWYVPRTLLPAAEEGDQFKVTELSIRHMKGPKAEFQWSLQEAQVNEQGGWGYPQWEHFTADRWTGEELFVFQTAKTPLDDGGYGSFTYETKGGNSFDYSGRERPETDIVGIGLDETEHDFTVSVQIASVKEDPGDHFLWVALGVPSGQVMEAGFEVENGQREFYAGYYTVPEWQWQDVQVEVEIETGDPGTVRITWDRTSIGSPKIGDSLSLGWAMMYGNAIHDRVVDHEVGPFGMTVHDRTGGFYRAESLPLFRFAMDTPESREESLGIMVEAQEGIDQMPPTLPTDDVNEDQFDIRHVQAIGRDASTVHVSLGVKDLARVDVPRGYDAVIYAVGVQTDTGDFMVFYYKDGEHQNYYCAPDTLLFGDDHSDPGGVVWSQIPGMLSHGGRSPQSGPGAAEGALSFQVPHECLGIDDDDDLFQIHDLAAGSFLLGDPVGIPELMEIHQVDRARADPGDLPFLLGVQTVDGGSQATPAWYVTPLGLEGQDWDILGVMLAVLLATGGAAVVWLRRRKLRRYLARVDQAAAIKDPSARETALAELRTALRSDLVAGQISEGHYTVVLRHIDEAMKHVRVKSIEETFRELPFHIVCKLRSVLDDGVITQHEREMVVDLVERAEIPAKYKQRVMSRLDRWRLVDEVAKA